MATPNDVLSIAAGEIGYYAPDDPLPGSKYGRWMAEYTGESWLAGPSTSIWWCMIFVSWCFNQAGMLKSIPGMPNYNCDNFKSKAGSIKLANKKDAKAGDIVLFDWNGDGSCDHVGLVEKNYGDYIQTLEGNTSGSANGSQSSGNGVWRRTRYWSSVNSVYRPNYSGTTKGWHRDSTGWWWSNGDGTWKSSRWEKIDGHWYYFNASGYAATGWRFLNNEWYYFWPDDKGSHVQCAMAKGWVSDGSHWFYCRPEKEGTHPEGSMYTGWLKDGGAWYYLKSGGYMACNEALTIGGKTYAFDVHGHMYDGIEPSGALVASVDSVEHP